MRFKTYIISVFVLLLSIEQVSATIYYSRASDRWDRNTTWSTVGCGGAQASSVPTALDTVVICSGYTIDARTDESVARIEIQGTLYWTAARIITISGDLVFNGGTLDGNRTGLINVGGDLSTSATCNIGRTDLNVSGNTVVSSTCNLINTIGTKSFSNFTITSSGVFTSAASEDISISGNFQNDGVFNIGTAMVTFNGAANRTISGSASTTFTGITIDKGSDASSVLDVQSIIVLPSVAGSGNGLQLLNGTFKLSSNSTIIPFPNGDVTTANFLIPSTTALWCNGGTINTMPGLTSAEIDGSGNWTVAGTLRISAGTLNIGDAADHLLRADNSGTTRLIMEGGFLNVSGRIGRQQNDDDIEFIVAGGVITLPTVGSTSSAFAPVNLDQPNSTFTMTGGSIVLERAGGSNLGIVVTAGTIGVSGGTIQIGNGNTPSTQVIGVNSLFGIANLSLNSINVTGMLQDDLTVLQQINIAAGTLNANNFDLNVGGTWTNNGSFVPGTGTVTFNGSGTQLITNPLGENFNNLRINKAFGTIYLANDVAIKDSLVMLSGSVECSTNLVTLGTSTVTPGELVYSSGSINGSFKRWLNAVATPYLFPLGSSSNSRAVQTTFSNLIPGNITAQFIPSDPGSNGLPLSENGLSIPNQYTEGYWDLIAGDGLSSNDYGLSCTGAGFISYSMGVATRLMYRSSADSAWLLDGAHVSAQGFAARRINLTSATGQFAFGKPVCSNYSVTTVFGDTTVCINDIGVSYAVLSNPANSYTWSVVGGSITSGQGTPTITVTWGNVPMESASVSVTEYDNCIQPGTTVSKNIWISPIPAANIEGPAPVPLGQLNNTYYTNLMPEYTYSWSLPAGGGTIVGGQGTNSVVIDWGIVVGTYTVQVNVTPICGSPQIKQFVLDVKDYIKSNGNGSWANSNSWVGGVVPTINDFVFIQAGHVITMNGNPGECKELVINGTANWSQTRTTNVGSNGIRINSTGNISSSAAGFLTTIGGFFGYNNANISSSAVTISMIGGAQNIFSSGEINRLDIQSSNVNVTGKVTIATGGALLGSGTLNVKSTGTLTINGMAVNPNTDFSEQGATVIFANGIQTVKAGIYSRLIIKDPGLKTLAGPLTVNDELTILSGSTLDVSAANYAMTVKGDWNNTGTFEPRFGTVTFDGLNNQALTCPAGEVFNNLIIAGTGTKTFNNSVTVNFDLSVSSTLNVGGNNLIISGNFDNTGSFIATAGCKVEFVNISSLLGAAPLSFQDVVITGSLTGSSSSFTVLGDWTDNGTFIHNGGEVIFDGVSAMSGTAESTFGDLTVNGLLTSSAGNINVQNNFTNNGVFNHNNGTITFNGSVPQVISGSTVTPFYNLVQNNASGVSLSQSAELYNTLTISSGTFTTTGQSFTLKSDAANTARVAAIPSGADLAGNIIMERFTGSGPTDWRMLSSSVSGVTLADWADDFATSGFTGSSDPANPFVSIYSYDETQAGDLNSFGWVPATNITNPIVSGLGYYVYLGPNPITYEVAGPPHKFNQSLPATYTGSGDINNDGWNLISNNYPSAIDWRNLSNWTKTNIDSALYVYNSSTGSYAYYASGFGINGGSRYIASSQAFWVKANSTTPVLSHVETAKASTQNPTFLKQKSLPNRSNYPMAFKDFPIPNNVNNTKNTLILTCSGNGKDDETMIRFDNNGTGQYDTDYDAWKLDNDIGIHNFSTIINDTSDLAINVLPDLTADQQIKLRLKVPASGNYTIRRDSVLMLPMSSCLSLEDLATSSSIDLRNNISYTFNIADTTLAPRFVLHISAPITKATISASCPDQADGWAIALGTGSGPWDYVWKDQQGSIIQSKTGITGPDTLSNLLPGTYWVEVTGGNCGMVTDTFIVSSPPAIESLVLTTDVSCNGLSDGAAQVQVSGGVSPYQYLWSTGQTEAMIQNLSEGSYSVAVTDANGCNAVFNAYVSPPVVSDFSPLADTLILATGDSAHFENSSSGAVLYQWDFGDTSAIVSAFEPVHYYQYPGTYTVILIASDGSCTDTSYYAIVVLDSTGTGVTPLSNGSDQYYMTDHQGNLFVMSQLNGFQNLTLELFNLIGEKVFTHHWIQYGPGLEKLPKLQIPSGIYLYSIHSAGSLYNGKVLVAGR